MLNLDPTSSYSFVDPGPDPHGSALILVDWIRFRNIDPDPDPEGLK
jgi:hypothetical protein